MEKEVKYKFTEEEVSKLMHLYLHKFVDIPKIIGAIDSEKADEFKKRNGSAYTYLHSEGKLEHHHHHDEGDL